MTLSLNLEISLYKLQNKNIKESKLKRLKEKALHLLMLVEKQQLLKLLSVLEPELLQLIENLYKITLEIRIIEFKR